MSTKAAIAIVPLSQLTSGQEAELFALLSSKEELTTRDGKPYFKVTFRDHAREVSFPIWNDSTWAIECREKWRPGAFFKLRAVYRDTNYGPQLDIGRSSISRRFARRSTGTRPTALIRQCVSRERDSTRKKCSTS
jgi:3'-5' exoribonuclease